MKQMSYITRWLYSTSHKDIGILYLIYGMISAMIGTGMSVIIRAELANGNSQFFHGNNHAFNVIITGHAIAMIFLFVMPVLIGAFGKLKLCYSSVYKKYLHINSHNSSLFINSNLCCYLTGLIEGDGNIYVFDNINKNKSPKISITFKDKDYELAIYLKEIFKIGKIIKRKTGNVFIWQIQSIEDVYKLLYYTNGYYRTPKYYLSIKAIKWINEYIDKPKYEVNNNFNIYNNIIRDKILSKITKLEIKPKDESNILDNAWFAGFSDADSYFGIILNKSKKKERISLRYSLEIKQNYTVSNLNESFYPIMLNIASAFKTNIYARSRNLKLNKNNLHKTYYSYIISINSLDKLELIINYFEKFPLLSSKYLDYKDWNKMLLCLKNKNNKGTDIEIIKKGNEIKANINNNRKRINFNHIKENKIYK